MIVSFKYENLVSQVQTIQSQTAEIETILQDRCKNNRQIPGDIKSHSFTFLDPYGNRMTKNYFDHQLISQVINQYKKTYIPKYLHSWIRVGTMEDDQIRPFHDFKSTVSTLTNGYQFITYGQVTVYLKEDDYFYDKKLEVPVLLMDKLEKIKKQIMEQQDLLDVEFKICLLDEEGDINRKDWEKGTRVEPKDTIISCQLFQDHCVIVAEIIKEKVKYLLSFQIIPAYSFFSLLTIRPNVLSAYRWRLRMRNVPTLLSLQLRK